MTDLEKYERRKHEAVVRTMVESADRLEEQIETMESCELMHAEAGILWGCLCWFDAYYGDTGEGWDIDHLRTRALRIHSTADEIINNAKQEQVERAAKGNHAALETFCKAVAPGEGMAS